MPLRNISDLIREQSKIRPLQNRSSYTSISHKDIESLSSSTGVKKREIEIEALENNIIPEHYVRNMNTFSTQDQVLLLKSSVCVVGLGGLGGFVVEILSRMGIGKMKLIDGDVFEDSNLNRQILSRPEAMGLSKAQEAENRVHQINPSIEIKSFASYFNQANSTLLLSDVNVAVDCLDTVKTRFLLEKNCKFLNIPMVFGAVAGHQGQVMAIFPEDEGIAKIFGPEAALPEKGIETHLGALASCVSLVASMECTEVIKIILGKGHLLRNRLLLINLLDSIFEVVEV
jgi:molybdopterin-synthase adenylyltransferase